MNSWHSLRIVLLMLLLGITSVSAYLFAIHQLYFCLLFSVLIIVGIVVTVVYSHNRATQKITRMVEAIRYGDFSLNFSKNQRGQWETQLVEDINAVMANFRYELAKKEERHQYYETLLQTVDSCLLVVDQQGQILWMNQSAEQQLCGYRIHQLAELDSLNKDFANTLHTLRPGKVKVVRIYREDLMQDMAVTVTDYSTTGTHLRLINLRNIRSVLEENEMEAWQKLVRVLTHEIMNSIAPIISLSDTLSERALQNGMNEKDYGVMLQGMQTIHRRSKGLLGFVENYRKLSRLASPILAPVRVGDLLDDIQKLFPASGVRYDYQIEDKDLQLMVDRSQMEQVLINLLKNASEACSENPQAEVCVATSYSAEKQIFQLSVTDNGCGILPDVLDKIFIPFFTTKPTGSGIGLTLCKQIVSLHGGSLQATSEIGKGSCFVLKLWVK